MAFILLLMELMLLLATAGLASLAWLAETHRVASAGNVYLTALLFAFLIVLSMSTLGMYQPDFRVHPGDALRVTVMRILPALLLAFCLLNLLARLLPGLGAGKLGSLAFVLGGAAVLLTRLLLYSTVRTDRMTERLILLGDGALAQECMELAASKQGFQRFHVVGCVAVAGEQRCVPAAHVLPAGPSLLELAREHGASEVVVSLGDRRGGAYPVRQLLECALGGVRVVDAASFFEREACQIRIDSVQPSYLIFGGGFDQSFLRASVKRAFDLTASGAICLAALPVMALTALLIRAEDGGPVFYQQERVGKDGRLFQVLKFRSMRSDAEQDGRPVWAAEDDPRITRIGRWIRKLRIDELPQMLNVFRGEMSFVGPRPERAFFVEQLARDVPYYEVRHSIKPGITGLAQVRYQYGASVDDAVQKLQYDLYYVKNNSLFLDLLILIDTVQVVLLGKGSR
ncbi:TIGR03013 family PEP-CTERM/XrtA system glycosyltransferase [Pseudoduganella sp. LjRoot289]|uniref:TIGR03013 family XrtA/PEP-CTERM system glycosyltransferase n=1 Tax=Pseudoduganella sp. LjRoot289 TaxID=3342314 RepID=UPI003ECEBC0B